MTTGMDPELYAQFIEQLERYVRERLVPAEDEVDALGRVPDDILDEMRGMGLFGVTMPEAYGGAGMNVTQYIGFVKAMSYAAPAFRSILSINVGMVQAAIAGFGTEAQKREWLPRLAGGEVAAFGLTEPDSGSDSAAMKTRAVRDGNGYRLNGTKRYITNAPFADMMLVMARTNADALPKNAHVSAFLVPRNTPGVAIGKPDEKMGQRGAQIADVILEDVHVDGDALLGGEEGIGFRAAMNSLNNGRLSVAGACVGYGRRILDTGVRYAVERTAFGEPIAKFQLVQAMLADSKAELYAAECMLDDACRRADAGENVILEAAAAKMFGSEMVGRIADRVVQVHGGAGYLKEYQAERFYRDVRIYRIYEGTTQIQQLVIAKQLLRQAGLAI